MLINMKKLEKWRWRTQKLVPDHSPTPDQIMCNITFTWTTISEWERKKKKQEKKAASFWLSSKATKISEAASAIRTNLLQSRVWLRLGISPTDCSSSSIHRQAKGVSHHSFSSQIKARRWCITTVVYIRQQILEGKRKPPYAIPETIQPTALCTVVMPALNKWILQG